MFRRTLLCRSVGALGLTFILAALAGGPAVSQEDARQKQIKEVRDKIAELEKKLSELSKSEPAKARRPLTFKDALAWKSAVRPTLSRNGKWFVCVVGGSGKSEVLARETATDKELRFQADAVGDLALSRDSRWLVFRSMARQASPASGGKVTLVELATGQKTEFDGVQRFSFSGESGATLALHRAAKSESPRGSDLILHDLATRKDLVLGNVAQFAFDKKGSRLTMLIDAQDQLGNGIQVRDMKTGELRQLESAKASFTGLTLSKDGDSCVLLKTAEDASTKERRTSILACANLASATPSLVAIDPASDKAFPKGMAVSSRGLELSEDGTMVFFGIQESKKAAASAKDSKSDASKGKSSDASKGKSAAPSTAKGPGDKPDLVIWHGSDARLQSQQQKEAPFDQSFSYLAACRVKDKKFVRLADDTVRQVSVAPKQRYAVGIDARNYERTGSLDGQRLHDVYVIDLQSGERHLALKRCRYPMGTSPDGSQMIYFEEGHYHVYDMAARKSRNVSKSVPTSFVNTEDDHNVDRPPTRLWGWTSDSSAVLISDNWDVWKVPVREGEAVNLTLNGKKDSVRYRFRFTLDPEEKGIDLSGPSYVSAFGEWTKKAGIGRLSGGKPGVEMLNWDDAEYGSLIKAAEADTFAFSRETVSDAPDYHASDVTFKSPRRLTRSNPDQEKFLWSSGSLLVDYKSTKGDRLQGALFLPAGYEKGKKYPTIVYIYERLSQGKNRYLRPGVGGGGFNASVYTSNGYAVFMPDIAYKVNDPGMSAVWCVLPALDAAVATGVVDPDRVGLHGHSWGGYQTSFLITQTDRFKSAVAGAPLTNLVSMYSSIYWNRGIANGPIFESSQGRFTAGYWDQMEAYLRNSPVIHAKKVKTPLMLLHNDKDGAVDFNQGVEYFNTLRRLNKSVVMLQYKGENHGLVKPANQKDYAVRMKEYFDHHLQGKDAPAWLKDGVPHLKMDEHLKSRQTDG